MNTINDTTRTTLIRYVTTTSYVTERVKAPTDGNQPAPLIPFGGLYRSEWGPRDPSYRAALANPPAREAWMDVDGTQWTAASRMVAA